MIPCLLLGNSFILLYLFCRKPIELVPISSPSVLPLNSHLMATRGKYGIKRAKFYNVFSSLDSIEEPISIQVAFQHPKWYKAMKVGFEALIKNNRQTSVPHPKGRKIIDNKWFFRIKKLFDANVERLKARVVVKGYNQVTRFDFSETFSLVINFSTIHVILTLALSFGWDMRKQMLTMLSCMLF